MRGFFLPEIPASPVGPVNIWVWFIHLLAFTLFSPRVPVQPALLPLE